MRIILSRKGFDSSSGGKPSPIFPDGRMVSLPIPDKSSPIRYADIGWQEFNIGAIVSELTTGRISASHCAHLDPDLCSNSISRLPNWRPLFGQTGAAQGHLRNSGVEIGDIFLFFGLFRHVVHALGKYDWDTGSQPRHALWGWLQIDEILQVNDCDANKYKWAQYHPHFHRGSDTNNTIYVAREYLTLPGLKTGEVVGAGVFPRFSQRVQLTAPCSATPTSWDLPHWFYPSSGKSPLTYHTDLGRWQKTVRGTRLNTVARGQEFVLDCCDYPEAYEWLAMLLRGAPIFS